MYKRSLILILLLLIPDQVKAASQPLAIDPHFGKYYASRGGLAFFGLPISELQTEVGRPVQYFERVRMESQPNGQVGLGLLGSELLPKQMPSYYIPTDSSGLYFSVTGYLLDNQVGFLNFWQKNGGLPMFGYPLSAAYDSKGTIVQWFERARFEYQPKGQVILLGRLGFEYLEQRQAASIMLSSQENELSLKLVDLRRSHNLLPPKIDLNLTALAQTRSQSMAKQGKLSHAPDLATQLKVAPAYRLAAELIQRNNAVPAETIDQAIKSWLASKASSTILWDTSYNSCGIGVSLAAEGTSYYSLICIVTYLL